MSNFTFDAKMHVYRLEGEPIPSVTDVLVDNGFCDPTFYTEEGKLRGRRVHLLCQFWDDGDLPISEAERFGLAGYLESWAKFRERKPFEIIESERPHYHPSLLYAGTPDRVISMDGKTTILDIKTGGPEKWHGLQTGAYAGLIGPNHKRFGVHLHEDGAMATLAPHNDFYDFARFSSLLVCTKLRRSHGITGLRRS